jgi:fermentation-respiration switch protein FrsA (DUF1100 family)
MDTTPYHRGRRRRERRRRLGVGLGALVAAACAFPLLDRLTHHPGETVILLMPPVLGVILYAGWRDVRRIPLRHYVVYVALMGPVIAGAMWVAATIARGRVLWVEVVLALWFLIAWRMAWALWKRTLGVVGERWRRWGRRARRRCGGLRGIGDPRRRRLAAWAMAISPARFCLVVLVFAPLVLGSLIHRIKIGNPRELDVYASLPIETVTFETADGLGLEGWFLPDGDSDATVIICHGAGANRGNFIEYLLVFHTRGYNALIFDFRGHGGSEGHTSTFGLFETADVRAAVDWLETERPARARHVYGLGSSMGAMALVRAAGDDGRIEAVILDSVFISAPALAHQHAARVPIVGPAMTDLVLAAMSLHAGRSMWSLDASEAIGRLSPRPVFLIHGDADVAIPRVNMERLYALAGEPKRRWLGPGPHSNIMTTAFDEYQRRVIEFLDAARGRDE